MAKILVISSNIHKELALLQRQRCLELLSASTHDSYLELSSAGVYEIPFIIKTYQDKKPFDAYLALGLVLKKNCEHFDYIMSHIKESFSHFALNNIAVGNGIIVGETVDELREKIESDDPCVSAYPSACAAVDYLIRFRENLS